MREVASDPVQLALGGGGEGGIEALVELLQRQPALCVVLAQARGRCLAVGVANAQVRSSRHLVLRELSSCRCGYADSKTIYRDAGRRQLYDDGAWPSRARPWQRARARALKRAGAGGCGH